MRPQTRWLAATILLIPLALVAARHSAQSSQHLKVAGTFFMRYVKQDAVAVVDHPGHVLVLTEARGLNHSTGRDVYMDGAEAWTGETGDLTDGSGNHAGHLVLAFRGDTVHTCWFGEVTTLPSASSGPVTEFKGKWAVTNASGRYQDASGQGTYRGRLTSPTEYTVNWEGELVLKEATASR